ncbi:PAS domain-containing sensor histidine kinase [Hwangdonia seohaensis]|uniref:histidine kinase n=1 Tax=Hwangdonia seohaensis TaxID=1240727 RepID=A0ABW3R8L6_9FLAO|nr:PAS domain-containing sensor histidine kinase [Hwangdonia seohaensis]
MKQQIWRENPENILEQFLTNDTSISIIDIIGRTIYANDKFSELIEIPHKRIIGELNIILKSERHANPIYKDLWNVIRSGRIWKGILTDYSSSGKLYRVDTTIIPGRNAEGDIDKFVAFYFNVKPKYDVNLNIVGSKTPDKTYYDSISNSVLTINAFAEIVNSNQGFGKLCEKEIAGCNLYSFINPIFHNKVKKIINNVFNTAKPDQFETIGINSNGVNAIFVSQIGPVLNNRGVVISATVSTQEVKGVSELKQELMENEAKYHAIFQSMEVGMVVVVDGEGKITEWNKGAELAFGYKESEIKGEYLTKLIASKNRKTSVLELINAVKKLEDFKSSDTVEMKCLKKNGTEFPVEFAISNWENGGSNFYCAMMLDITNRKKTENCLKSKTKELELFLYRSAHDLKAPLSSAEGLLNLIKEEDLNESVSNLTSMLDITLDRGKKMIDKLMRASEISDKKKDSVFIDFKKIVGDVLKSLKGLEGYNTIEFKIDISDTIQYYSSVELIYSLFQNLVQNAIIYTVSKNRQEKSIIAIEVKETPNAIKIKIRDNGIGILKKNLSKVFNLYFRENIEDVPGSGLGLYIVKNITEDLNGKIKVTSKVNEGTCFKIKLNKVKKE